MPPEKSAGGQRLGSEGMLAESPSHALHALHMSHTVLHSCTWTLGKQQSLSWEMVRKQAEGGRISRKQSSEGSKTPPGASEILRQIPPRKDDVGRVCVVY